MKGRRLLCVVLWERQESSEVSVRGVGNRTRPRITPSNVHRGEAEGKLSEGPE